jgi:hypothetical protein
MESIDSYRLITVRKLVDVGVDILLEDNFEKTALYYIPKRDTECIQYLQEVINNCTKTTGFKRAKMNTDNDNEEDEEDSMGVNENKT